MKEKKHYEAIHRTYEVEGDLSYCLDAFGDELAKRQGYKDIDGMEAVDFYLINRFHWLPSQVRAMTPRGQEIRSDPGDGVALCYQPPRALVERSSVIAKSAPTSAGR
jgi:hypothetical protein